MVVQVEEVLMGMGSYSVGIDYRADLAAEFLNDQGKPRKVHLLFYDPDDTLIYTGLLLRVDGDETGLILSGHNLLWYLGDDEIGPVVVDHEYVSGSNKLSNGGLELEELYWRFAEDTGWALQTGGAHAGSLALAHSTATAKDDIVQSEEKFPTRPGYEYVTAGWAKRTAGTVGRIRLRTVYEGAFDPPNVLPYGDFEDLIGWSLAPHIGIFPAAARSGNYGLLFDTIPKPQLVTNHDFSGGGTGWTLGADFSIDSSFGAYSWGSNALIALTNPQPQYIGDPSFELGTDSWTDVSEFPTDMDITDAFPGEGFGDWVMRVGPVTQKQIVTNPNFDSDLSNWIMTSDVATPDPGLFYWFATDGLDGTGAASTDAASPTGRVHKYLRADPVAGGGVDEHTVVPGESYEIAAYIRRSPTADGFAYISGAIPHPADIASAMRWWVSQNVNEQLEGDTMQRVAFNVSIPDNRTELNLLFEVHEHTAGVWSVDNYTATRTRGNRARIVADTAYPVIANTEYRFAADVRSGDEQQVGSVRLGVILKGPGMEDMEVAVDKGSTDYVWNRVIVDVRPETGYTTATPFVAAQDIIGASAWVDLITFSRVSNNTSLTRHSEFAIIPDQRYRLSADVMVFGATRGKVDVGVLLSGPTVADELIEVSRGVSDDTTAQAISTEIRPGPGYTTAEVYVRSTDIEGGIFVIDNATLVKMDNNTDVTEGTQFPVTAERTYRAQGYARSGADLQRGTVHFAVRYLGEGRDDIIEEFSAIQPTDGDWKLHHFDFTPPSGYNVAALRAISTDIEGATWAVDDLTVVDQDRSTVVFDFPAPIALHDYTLMAQDTTAPAGAEFVRVEVVAEAGADGYVVDSVNLWRDGVTPATGDAIVADLLSGLPVVAGNVNCPEVIPYDWLILNRTRRDALTHFCDVVSEPRREYHLNPDRTLDVGTPAAVFDDHSPDSATPVVLLVDDLDVEELPPTVRDVESRPTHVKVIGAERQTVSGTPLLISATSAVPGAAETDWNGLPITRTKIVSDATVDHFGYAQAYADDLAAKEAEPALALTAKLTGINTRPPFKVGDWIYAYDPEAGLEDAGNATIIEGQPVFPRRVRVLSRTRDLGPQHRIEVRRTDGTTFDLTGILWSAEDATSLVIGDRFPEWAADPQAQAAGVQYLRDRASSPR